MIVVVSTMATVVSAADVRCRSCGRLLFRWVKGSATIDMKCTRCGSRLTVSLSTSAHH